MNSKEKEDFAKAMKDLLNGEESAAEKTNTDTSALSFSEPAKAAPEASVVAAAPVPTPAPTTAPAAQVVAAQVSDTASTTSVPVSEDSQAGRQSFSIPPEPPGPPSDEVTIIAPGTKIVGDIETDGGLQVGGSIKGNLRVASKLELKGKIIGDIIASDISIAESVVKGNIVAYNMLIVDKDTTVVGDLTAKNAEVDGKIKGNVTVSDRAYIKAESVLVGNLASGTVNIEEGAMLKGDISITSLQDRNLQVEDIEFDIIID